MRFHPLAIAIVAVVAQCEADVKVGEPAPEISLDLLLPERPVADVILHALAGKAVVLEFWATWCGPCIAAIPHLNDLAAKFENRPVVFLAVTDEARAGGNDRCGGPNRRGAFPRRIEAGDAGSAVGGEAGECCAQAQF